MKLIGKLQDGTVFLKKGHDDDQPFEFKIDEGTLNNGFNFNFLTLILGYCSNPQHLFQNKLNMYLLCPV